MQAAAKASFLGIHSSQRKKQTLKILSLLLPLRQICSGSVKPQTNDEIECPYCLDCVTDPVISSCKHTFCRDCIGSQLSLTGTVACPTCTKDITLARLKDAPPSAPHPPYASAAAKPAQSKASLKEGSVFQSKVKFLLESLDELKSKDSTAKVLIFSQFNETLDKLKVALTNKGIMFRTLRGDMTRKERTAALDQFQNDPPTTIFLLSTRAAACGINLTQANHVFIMEPSFNVALEAQAIGRVYRMGQTRPTTIVRICAKETIEERMLDGRTAAPAAPADPLSFTSVQAGWVLSDANYKKTKLARYVDAASAGASASKKYCTCGRAGCGNPPPNGDYYLRHRDPSSPTGWVYKLTADGEIKPAVESTAVELNAGAITREHVGAYDFDQLFS